MSRRDDKINELKTSYEDVQKKTFTKWTNSFIKDRGFEIHDLFTDLQDGRALIALLEKLSNETLVGAPPLLLTFLQSYVTFQPKPTKGTMRIHKVEAVNKALAFLKSKVCFSVCMKPILNVCIFCVDSGQAYWR